MLITLRSKGASWVVKGLFVVLIGSFALWGVPDIYRNIGSAPVAATVGDTDITAAELRRAVDRAMKQLQNQLGNQVDAAQFRPQVLERTLDTMIERRLSEAYATDLGMVVPDDVLKDSLRQIDPRLLTPTGAVNSFMVAQMLQQLDMSEQQFFDERRLDILGENLVQAMTADVQTPRSLAETLYAYRNEQRVAHTLAIPDSSITDVPTPDDAVIAQFHKDNADRFQAPEYRALTLVRLDPEEYAQKYSVTDDAVQAEYDSRQSEFNIPEKRAIVQVVLPDEAAAKDLAAKVRQGTPFADAVKAATSDDPIDVGTFAQFDLQNRLAAVFSDETAGRQATEALFAAAVGGVSDPVKGPIGWHVLSVTSVEPPKVQPLDDDLRAKLRHALAVRQAIDELVDVANQLDDDLGAGTALADAAGKLGLAVTKIAAVDNSGKDPDGKEVAPVTRDQGQALKLAFQTSEGEDSLLTEMPNGGYVILHVDNVRPAATRPLESVRDTVIADWQAVERKKVADAKAQAIVERINKSGESIGTIARELGVPVLVSQPLTRAGNDPEVNVGGTLTEKLFAAKAGEAIADRAPADNAAVVAVLIQVKPADIAASGAELDKLQQDLGRFMGGDLYEQLSADLEEKIGVSRNQDIVDSLYAK